MLVIIHFKTRCECTFSQMFSNYFFERFGEKGRTFNGTSFRTADFREIHFKEHCYAHLMHSVEVSVLIDNGKRGSPAELICCKRLFPKQILNYDRMRFE